MKILYCITKADTGGAQTHLIQLANYFAKKNDVYVIVGNNGPMLDKLSEKIKVIVLNDLVGPISLNHDILAIKKIAKLINSIKPDIIHYHSSKAGTVGRLAYKFSKVKSSFIIFTAHSWAFTEGIGLFKKLLYRNIEKIMLNITDKVICVSKFDENLALKYNFNANKLVMIHNGVNIESNLMKTKNEKNNGEDRIIKFVMLARFSYPKMQSEVIQAVYLLKNITSKNFEVNFIGDGEFLVENQALVDSLNLNDEIKFLGDVNNASNLLVNYDVFILMSKHEGLPISIIEAMANRLPIIASNVGGVEELIEDNGSLLKKNSAEELALIMLKYMNIDLIEKEGKRSRDKFLNEYTEIKMIKELECLYDNYSKK
ncbi:glycosyltransferase family 4 protein [Staphylococcus sp. IPLA37010]|uniref:Glycosyltransferase family 4 protein n=1 Tax=Staphylococcus equorum TaxID=246432 RepID=A0AAW7AK50_9STAP|nr:glycosyltransferase family 4 protein [Staphylococcus equorum]MDK9867002.1 glycosyltransferase family 4 protein [Staphylococcus equorum]